VNNKFCLFIFILLFLGCTKERNHELAQTYHKLAMVELIDGEGGEYAYKKALGHINTSLKHEVRPEYLALKGTILFKLNQDEAGCDFFDEALKIAKLNMDLALKADILNNKACLLAKIGMQKPEKNKVDEALKIWDKLQNDKNYLTKEVALFNQSKIYIFQGNYQKAKQALHKAICVAPNYMDAHYYLASVAFTLRDFALAKNEVATVLYLQPGHKGAEELNNILQNY
jgi:tetratricopeptide (TPR) repeat protein